MQSNDFPKSYIVVLKPSLFGINHSLTIIKRFALVNIPTIISSSYDLPLEYNHLLDLAAISDQSNHCLLYHGLNTFKFTHSKQVNFDIIGNEILFDQF